MPFQYAVDGVAHEYQDTLVVRSMRGKWLLFSGIVILLAIAAGALSVLRKPAAEAPKKAAEQPAQTAATDEIAIMGKLQAAHIVPIPAPVDGILDSWEVEVGQEVLEGQLIGHVANTTLESAREQAQLELERAQTKVTNIEGQILAARLEASRADADASRTSFEASRLEKAYQREQMLFKEGATPRLKFEKAEKEFKTAQEEANTAKELAASSADRAQKLEKDLQLAKTALEDRTHGLDDAKADVDSSNILAPSDGVVIRLAVDAGANVERGMRELVQIAVDPSIMELVVEPEPKVLEKIKQGQQALVLLPDVTSEALAGEVREVKGNQVIIEFVSPNPEIKHGMTASARIKLS
jgi:multidrug resistance efflux pump